MAVSRTTGRIPAGQKVSWCEDEGDEELSDWKLPLCFTQRRHMENIVGRQDLAEGWRMKERVGCLRRRMARWLELCVCLCVDEDCECGACVVSQCRC